MHFLSLVALSALLTAVPSAIGTPVASPDPAPSPILIDNLTSGNAYSGTGGTAVGGSVNNTSTGTGLIDTITGGKSLLSLGSENAGDGGNASSGSATARGGGRGGRGGRRRPGLGGILGPGGILGSIPIAGLNLDSVTSTRNQNNAYSGAGGNASGGNVNSPGSLIDLFSHNAGNAGTANSGPSRVTRRSDMYKNRIEKHAEYEPRAVPLPPSFETRRIIRVSRPTF